MRALPFFAPQASQAQTPIERRGDCWVKRDDLYYQAGVEGGKVRTCWQLAQGATGLVTAGSRSSPQVNIVAHIAHRLGVPCRVHTSTGALSPEVLQAQATGAEVVQHTPGYNSVIIKRAADDAAARGWRNIPFGMECEEAVEQTASQVEDLPPARRLVVPVGSGMSLAGILAGLSVRGLRLPVLGVVVGADPRRRLERYAPFRWWDTCTLIPAGVPYKYEAPNTWRGLLLDAVYEAKCLPYLQPEDLFWVVGIRATARQQ
jgi:1-aminocyclopropane-1-carboxylate deaminase/D-cysteine desulfhydrase-like pyridoxal-dependent ACC family enzyme